MIVNLVSVFRGQNSTVIAWTETFVLNSANLILMCKSHPDLFFGRNLEQINMK